MSNNKQNDPNRKALAKVLIPHLESFEKIGQWTDLGNWLQKTARFLESYPTKYIPKKKLLAKRLSQCLQEGLPIGIHKTTLSIYNLIFENIRSDLNILCQDIHYYSFGLYPFFPKSSIQIKPDVLAIFRNNYLVLKQEITPMLSGLTTSLLPALEEQEEGLQKQIFEFLDDLCKIVGDSFFISTIWFILLKNSKNRSSAFKILCRMFARNDDNNKLVISHQNSGNQNTNEQSLQNINNLQDKIILNENQNFENNNIQISNTNNNSVTQQNLLKQNVTEEQLISNPIEMVELKTIYLEQQDKTQNSLQNNNIQDSAQQRRKSYFPNKEAVINGLIKCLEDPDVTIRKQCLDFCIKYLLPSELVFFPNDQTIQLFFHMIKLFRDNDLSVVKRIFKYFFNTNEISQIDFEQNQQTFDVFVKAFQELFKIVPNNPSEGELPFNILQNIKRNNDSLMIKLIEMSSYEITVFCFTHCSVQVSNCSQIIIIKLQDFLKENQNHLENFVYNFQMQVDLHSKSFQLVYLLEYFLKSFILENELKAETKLGFVFSLFDVVLDQLIKLGSTDIISTETELGRLSRFKQLDSLLLLSTELTIFIGKFKQSDNLSDDIQNRTQQIRDKFTEEIDILVQIPVNRNNILESFSKYFEIPKKLDQQIKRGIQVTEFPPWILLLLKYIKSEDEMVSYRAVKFIHDLFEEKEPGVLVDYQKMLHSGDTIVDSGVNCEILSKVIEFMEISDFKKLSLRYFNRFIRVNKNIVNAMLLKMIKSKNNSDFKRVVNVWKSTFNLQNLECKQILQGTVFEMLDFASNPDPLIKNSFKSWLVDTQENFSVILESVFKELIRVTNWTVINENILYNYPFDCKRILSSIDHLQVLFSLGDKSFIDYITRNSITDEFDFYNEELDFVLKDHFDFHSKIYIIFLIKVLLRYLFSEPNDEVLKNDEGYLQNKNGLSGVKVQIPAYIVKLLSNIEDFSLLVSISVKMVPAIRKVLKKSLIDKDISLQLEYLGLLSFLIFRSRAHEDQSSRIELMKSFENPSFLEVILEGLRGEHAFVIREFSFFINQFCYLVSQLFKHPNLTALIKSVIFDYLQNIQKRCSQIRNLKEEEKQREVVQILIKGLRINLDLFLQVKEIEEKLSSGKVERVFLAVLTLGIVQSRDEIRKKTTFQQDEVTCRHILNSFETLFETFLACWRGLNVVNNFGLYEKFSMNEVYLLDKQEKDLIGIPRQILKVMKPLCNNFMNRAVEALITNWMKNNDCLKIETHHLIESHLENIKIIEIFEFVKASPIRVLYSLLEGKQVKNVGQLRRYEQNNSKKKQNLILEAMNYECNVLSFIFAYIKYVRAKEDQHFELYSIVILILKSFKNSSTPQTLFWLLEIIVLFFEKFKFDLNQYAKLKTEWFVLVEDLLVKCFKILSKEFIIVYESSFCTPLPLPPSVGTLLAMSDKQKQYKEIIYQNKEYIDINFNDDPVIIDFRNRVFLIQTLSQTLSKISKIFYSSSKTGFFSPVKMRSHIEKIFQILRERDPSEQLINEKASQIFVQLMNDNPQFLKEFKKELLEYFEEEDFFNVSPETLKQWSKIIDRFLEVTNLDLMSTYFEKQLKKCQFQFSFQKQKQRKQTQNKNILKNLFYCLFRVVQQVMLRNISIRKLQKFSQKKLNMYSKKKIYIRVQLFQFYSVLEFCYQDQKERL